MDSVAVNAVFQDCDIEELKRSAAATATARGGLQGMLDALGAQIRTDQLPDLDPLTGLLSAIDKVLQGHLSQRLPAASDTTEAEAEATETLSGPGSAKAASGSQVAPGQIGSRDDVVRAIDRVCDYYSRYEPSSPVPLLLMRARRLATGSFLDIVRDLAPGALSEIEKVCGPETKP